MDLVPAPVPLISPGQYLDSPEPRWRLRPPVHLHTTSDSRPVLRPLDMPFPSASRLVFKAWFPDTLAALQEYTQYLLGQNTVQPLWLAACYPQTIFLAHSLRPEAILKFDSHFECGNLSRAYALSDTEYDLYVSPDTNTYGHTQWFYFSVSRTRPNVPIKFNIVNLSKGNSLLAHGLRPVYRTLHSDWAKVPGQVHFYRNGYERCYWSKSVTVTDAEITEAKTGSYFTLSFTHVFSKVNDTVYFAFSVPYPFSRLVGLVDSLRSEFAVIRKEALCHTTLGLELPVVTLTAPKGQGLSVKKRQAVVFSARVHPGETPSSFILEGLMKMMCEEKEGVRHLLGLYVFHFIPILNPDGVVLGNYRSCIEGVDLNRRWQSSELPVILALRRYIQTLGSERKIALFCDLHAHAKKNNAFIYGCNTASDGGFTTWTKVRLFPRVLARISPYFNYEACKFKVQKQKLGTGRVVIWKEFSVTNSFTLETSFHAYRKGHDMVEFQEQDYLSFATHIVDSLWKYSALIEQFEQELGLNGGWLKPGKLKEMTGIPAQQVAVMEQEEMMKRERMKQARVSGMQGTPAARSNSARAKRLIRHLDDPYSSLPFTHRKLRIRGKEPQGWRDYFTEEEVQTVLTQLKEDKDYYESESSGSDSDPSDGNFSENDEENPPFEILEREEETKSPVMEVDRSAPPPYKVSPTPVVDLVLPTLSVPVTLPKVPSEHPCPSKPCQAPPTIKQLTVAPATRADHSLTRPPVYPAYPYPVSDINTIIRGSHRSNASFDYSDFKRPRIHRDTHRPKRSTSPLFLIESFTAKREPQPRTIKTLASTQQFATDTLKNAYFRSRNGLSGTTRPGMKGMGRRKS